MQYKKHYLTIISCAVILAACGGGDGGNSGGGDGGNSGGGGGGGGSGSGSGGEQDPDKMPDGAKLLVGGDNCAPLDAVKYFKNFEPVNSFYLGEPPEDAYTFFVSQPRAIKSNKLDYARDKEGKILTKAGYYFDLTFMTMVGTHLDMSNFENSSLVEYPEFKKYQWGHSVGPHLTKDGIAVRMIDTNNIPTKNGSAYRFRIVNNSTAVNSLKDVSCFNKWTWGKFTHIAGQSCIAKTADGAWIFVDMPFSFKDTDPERLADEIKRQISKTTNDPNTIKFYQTKKNIEINDYDNPKLPIMLRYYKENLDANCDPKASYGAGKLISRKR